MEALPLGRIAALVPEFAVKDTDDDDDDGGGGTGSFRQANCRLLQPFMQRGITPASIVCRFSELKLFSFSSLMKVPLIGKEIEQYV